MGAVLGLLMLVFAGVWGSIFLHQHWQLTNRQIDGTPDDPRLTALQEAQELLEQRLELVEEELTFYRELHAPKEPDRLGDGSGGDSS